jgi:hypothetical protein
VTPGIAELAALVRLTPNEKRREYMVEMERIARISLFRKRNAHLLISVPAEDRARAFRDATQNMNAALEAWTRLNDKIVLSEMEDEIGR